MKTAVWRKRRDGMWCAVIDGEVSIGYSRFQMVWYWKQKEFYSVMRYW